jgi:hypothetical protein
MTPTDAAVFWAELQRGLRQVQYIRRKPDWRRRRTGEMAVTLTERRAMQAFHLLHGESYSALATRFQRDRHCMSRWIWDDDYRAFYAHYWGFDGRLGSARPRTEAARTDEGVTAT